MFRFAAGLTLLVLVGSCAHKEAGSDAASTGGSASQLNVFYQAGREGQLEPCGCHTTPYGGIDREFNALQALRKDGDLFLDVGNLFVSSEPKGAPLDLYKARSEKLVNMLNQEKLDAYQPGPLDYKLGLDVLKQRQAQAKFKFVSSNVVDASGKDVFEPFVILQAGAIPVAVLGVIPSSAKLPKGLKVEDPKASIEKQLKAIGDKAKFVIVLSQLGDHVVDNKLSAELPGTHLWIGNDPNRTLHRANPQHGQLLADGHRYGYYLGHLKADLKFPIKGFYSDVVVNMNRETVKGFEASAAKKSDPKEKALLEKRIADLRKKEVMDPIEGGVLFVHDLIPLDEKTYGKPNEFTEEIGKEAEAIRKSAIDSAPKSKLKKK